VSDLSYSRAALTGLLSKVMVTISVEFDWEQIRLKFIRNGPSGKGLSLSAISTALCANRCKNLAEQLEP
jgi:hypothetical protein